MAGKTLYDKLWDDHVVCAEPDGSALIYIDRHLIHEVTSPQAFEGLRLSGRKPWRPAANLATADHNVPTAGREHGVGDPVARLQIETLDQNCADFDITEFDMSDERQGIVHVIGPEQGATLPGMTIVCGDSHTSTHGAFGALAFGIGTSEVEHVLATQCLVQRKAKNLLIRVNGESGPGVSAKDIILAVIGKIGTAGGTGYTIEFAGSAIRRLSMEGRMTVCNMAIEAGARAGLVAVDDTTISYLQERPYAPGGDLWEKAVAAWADLHSDEDAVFDAVVELDASEIAPQVTWGTSPEMVLPVDAAVPDPRQESDPVKREGMNRALRYMDLQPGTSITAIQVDRVFIGSCTNGRIEDLRAAAGVVKGRKVAQNIQQALVVPGSGLVKRQAEKEGLDRVFLEAGFEWRDPGCSMCLAMNTDRLEPRERCASTSNRNFEGRQGYGGRTHLVSPAMAAAAAVHGHFVDIRGVIAPSTPATSSSPIEKPVAVIEEPPEASVSSPEAVLEATAETPEPTRGLIFPETTTEPPEPVSVPVPEVATEAPEPIPVPEATIGTAAPVPTPGSEVATATPIERPEMPAPAANAMPVPKKPAESLKKSARPNHHPHARKRKPRR